MSDPMKNALIGLAIGGGILAVCLIVFGQGPAYPASMGERWLQARGYTYAKSIDFSRNSPECGKGVPSHTYQAMSGLGNMERITVCFVGQKIYSPMLGR